MCLVTILRGGVGKCAPPLRSFCTSPENFCTSPEKACTSPGKVLMIDQSESLMVAWGLHFVETVSSTLLIEHFERNFVAIVMKGKIG
jgi:hypothetical protein